VRRCGGAEVAGGDGGFMLDAKFRECSILMRPPAGFAGINFNGARGRERYHPFGNCWRFEREAFRGPRLIARTN